MCRSNIYIMILDKKVLVKFGTRSFKWYKDKGYNLNGVSEIEVLIEDLTEYSSAIVNIKCTLCGVIKKSKYFSYRHALNKLDGFYYCKKCSHVNIKKTNLERYGVSCPLQNELVNKKTKKTIFDKYGVDNISKVDFIRLDRSNLMKQNTFKYNLIIKNKFKTNNISSLLHIKEKKKITTMKNWGVENPSQNPYIFEKSQKSGKKIKLHEIGLYYRGTYEKDFLDYCLLNNIIVEKGPTIKYLFKNKFKYYHSDFFIRNQNLIIEIKSSYYYNLYESMNIAKKEESIKQGYKYLILIDKIYEEFFRYLKNSS